MSGLFQTLGIGAEALFTSRQGVDTAGHNIANAQTEGYSRQRVDVGQRDPSVNRGIVIGNGVFVKSISRAHDRFLEKQINDNNIRAGFTNTMSEQLKSLEGIYSPELNTSVADQIAGFFSSLQDLANFPEEAIVRTNVVESAQNVVQAVRRVDDSLRGFQDDINGRIAGEVKEIDLIVKQIAELNLTIGSLETAEDKQANDIRDQQDKLIRTLSEKMEIHYYRNERGLVVVRGPSDTLLVDRGHAAAVEVIGKENTPGFYDVAVIDGGRASLKTISEQNRGGRLKALFNLRDHVVPGLLEKNNSITKTFADKVNEVHSQGYGLREFSSTTGRHIFDVSNDPDFAARTLKISDVIAETSNAISVAASANAPGDNVICNELLRLEKAKLMEGGRSTLIDYYANYVGVFGLEIVRAEHAREADQIMMGELKTRREAISGVSLDEEATNLMRWQANFTASSRVITTVDEMLDTLLNLKR